MARELIYGDNPFLTAETAGIQSKPALSDSEKDSEAQLAETAARFFADMHLPLRISSMRPEVVAAATAAYKDALSVKGYSRPEIDEIIRTFDFDRVERARLDREKNQQEQREKDNDMFAEEILVVKEGGKLKYFKRFMKDGKEICQEMQKDEVEKMIRTKKKVRINGEEVDDVKQLQGIAGAVAENSVENVANLERIKGARKLRHKDIEENELLYPNVPPNAHTREKQLVSARGVNE